MRVLLFLTSIFLCNLAFSTTFSIKVRYLNPEVVKELSKYGKVKGIIPQINRVFIAVQDINLKEAILGLPFVDSLSLVTKGRFPGKLSVYSSFKSFSQWHISAMGIEKLWDSGILGDGVVIALIDTGVDYNIPSLSGKILFEEGYDFGDDDSNPMDENGHGTSMASLMVSGGELKGLAPNARIIPIKIAPNGRGTFETDALSKAIVFAADKGVDIINLSLLGDYSPEVEDAIRYATSKGIFVVAAAGNENEPDTGFPANLPGVIAVSSVSEDKRPSSFSNFGFNTSLSAPGENLLTYTKRGQAVYVSGTSGATALVSASLALLLSAGISKDELPTYIIEGSEDLGWPGYDQDYGFGMVRPDNSLKLWKERGVCIIPSNLKLLIGGKGKVFFSGELEDVKIVEGEDVVEVDASTGSEGYITLSALKEGYGKVVLSTEYGEGFIDVFVENHPIVSLDLEGCENSVLLSLLGVAGKMADIILIQISYFSSGMWSKVVCKYLVYPNSFFDYPVPYNYPFGHLLFDEDIELSFLSSPILLSVPFSGMAEVSLSMVVEDTLYSDRDFITR